MHASQHFQTQKHVTSPRSPLLPYLDRDMHPRKSSVPLREEAVQHCGPGGRTHCQLWVATPKTVPMSEIIAIAPRLGRTQVPKQSPQARLPCFGCISSSVLCCGVPLHGFGFSLTQPYPMQLINLCLSGLVQDSRTAALPQVMRQLRLYYDLRPLAKCTQAVQDVFGSPFCLLFCMFALRLLLESGQLCFSCIAQLRPPRPTRLSRADADADCNH